MSSFSQMPLVTNRLTGRFFSHIVSPQRARCTPPTLINSYLFVSCEFGFFNSSYLQHKTLHKHEYGIKLVLIHWLCIWGYSLCPVCFSKKAGITIGTQRCSKKGALYFTLVALFFSFTPLNFNNKNRSLSSTTFL